ncbi:hypothetical protein CAPTEDRAFT_226879, partial [Capitella teleta]
MAGLNYSSDDSGMWGEGDRSTVKHEADEEEEIVVDSPEPNGSSFPLDNFKPFPANDAGGATANPMPFPLQPHVSSAERIWTSSEEDVDVVSVSEPANDNRQPEYVSSDFQSALGATSPPSEEHSLEASAAYPFFTHGHGTAFVMLPQDPPQIPNYTAPIAASMPPPMHSPRYAGWHAPELPSGGTHRKRRASSNRERENLMKRSPEPSDVSNGWSDTSEDTDVDVLSDALLDVQGPPGQSSQLSVPDDQVRNPLCDVNSDQSDDDEIEVQENSADAGSDSDVEVVQVIHRMRRQSGLPGRYSGVVVDLTGPDLGEKYSHAYLSDCEHLSSDETHAAAEGIQEVEPPEPVGETSPPLEITASEQPPVEPQEPPPPAHCRRWNSCRFQNAPQHNPPAPPKE